MSERDDDIWARMVLWVSEQTGLSGDEVTACLEAQAEYWDQHTRLSQAFMSDSDDD